MRGTDAKNGKALSDLAHLKQSIRDILTTPVGSRIMRRDYGSKLYQLTDAPMNNATMMDIYAATAGALRKWEPRVKVSSIVPKVLTPGRIELELTGTYGSSTVTVSVSV